MHRSHYIRQKFLVESDEASGIDLDKIILQNFDDSEIQDFGTGHNLFDLGSRLERKIKISDFDKMIDTQSDFDDFAQKLEEDSILYIENDRTNVENPIYKDFSRSLFEKLSWKLRQRQIECRIYQQNNHHNQNLC